MPVRIVRKDSTFKVIERCIFGGQGLGLDEELGFFPGLTTNLTDAQRDIVGTIRELTRVDSLVSRFVEAAADEAAVAHNVDLRASGQEHDELTAEGHVDVDARVGRGVEPRPENSFLIDGIETTKPEQAAKIPLVHRVGFQEGRVEEELLAARMRAFHADTVVLPPNDGPVSHAVGFFRVVGVRD